MKVFITFGQSHVHNIDGKIFDKDCVAVIESPTFEEGRKKAFDVFSSTFCFSYSEEEFNMNNMIYFPRGFINIR